MNMYQGTITQDKTKSLNHFINDTFKWMVIGILVTFVTAFGVDHTPLKTLNESYIPMLAIFLQIAVVLVLSTRIMKIKTATVKVLYLLYAFITGITFSVVISYYTTFSVTTAFALSALYFGVLVLFGTYTKCDLTKVGNICLIGLGVYIVYSIIALIFHFGVDSLLMPLISIVLFAGITAYDMQKTINLYYQYQEHHAMLNKLSIYAALSLYLDFVNIFLDILRLIGEEK